MEEADSRSIVKTVRFSANEIAQIEALSATNGYQSFSRYLREKGLGQVRSRTDRQTLHQLVKIGVNLNQIARSMNMGRVIQEEARSALLEWRELVKKISAKIDDCEEQ